MAQNKIPHAKLTIVLFLWNLIWPYASHSDDNGKNRQIEPQADEELKAMHIELKRGPLSRASRAPGDFP